MKRDIFALFLLTLGAIGLFAFAETLAPDKEILRVGDVKLEIEYAKTREEITLGLSGREKLPADTGMLFVFEKSDYHAIWMKDMNFAIDIIWIDVDKKIVDIKHNVSPESYPESFKPSLPARYVLEVNAGWAEQNDIKVGDGAAF